MLRNAAQYGSAIYARVERELEQTVGLGHALSLEHKSYPKVKGSKLIKGDFGRKGRQGR